MKEITVGEMVAEDHRIAEVFTRNKIDFCCKGNRTLQEVCQLQGITMEHIQAELKKATMANNEQEHDFNNMSLDQLADSIERTHHKYVEEKLPELKAYLQKLVAVHGEAHSELFEIEALFRASAGELAKHMKKEELILFPYIRKMVKAMKFGEPLEPAHFGTVSNPITMMEQEHANEGERFRVIAELSNDFVPPADACNTYVVAYALLKEFLTDLHIHIHKENNILFPKAKELERELSGLAEA